ncbi:MAG: glycerol-3-phosphate dehydrogenase/oxidase [Candidatus Heimdallarchaeota archaeon]|nr:glycerol-3-phosphate dehydrogenase/oxidase [Candidatus Heimdallarchaeota archaeon]MBY8993069.1 glycerol-3-phosphate dehydrogenase/oxidase [Candidatus Heimdallarchaeota archaeon]
MTSIAIEQRNKELELLAKHEFDILIVGAGITGAGIAWDAAMRGLKVAIIDKEDFGAGTSSGSSKLVHAGMRYLAYLEFNLVKRASQERMWMFQAFPHITEPMPFLIPIFKKEKNNFVRMFFAGTLYDILSRFKNTRNSTFLSKEKTLEKIPNLRSNTLKRSLFYWDGVMDDARVTLETILSAQENGAITVNHVMAKSFIKETKSETGEVVKGVNAIDTLSDEKITIKAKVIINATGPWTDQVIKLLGDESKLLRLTKGIHIVTKKIFDSKTIAVVVTDDRREMFVIPFRKKYTLIGTTDTDYKDKLDHVAVTQEDIDYVVSAVNNDFPGSITKDDVISAYSGIRPLILSQKAKSETATSRWFEIIETRPNLLTVTGGKYTIFRYMAEKSVNKCLEVLNLSKKDYPCKTKNSQLHGGQGITYIIDYLRKHVPPLMKKYDLDFEVVDHIVHTYGTSHTMIFDLIDKNKELKERIAEDRPHILAEIIYILENEMCHTLSDFLLRRTQLQLIENQALDCVDKVANEMGKILGWDAKRKKEEIANYKKDLMWKP